jgi:hypothetical protein
MVIDLEKFIITGVLAGIEPGSSKDDIVSMFGTPEIDTPQYKSYPSILVYGCIEFRLRNNRLGTVAIDLSDAPLNLPKGAELVSISKLCRTRIEGLLEKHGLKWKLDELMSEEGTPVIFTMKGVHLAFKGETLVRAVADYVR